MSAATVAALMQRIESLTVAEAETIAASSSADARERVRTAARDEAWNAGGWETWTEAWDTAFKAGAIPAAAASNARRESGEWVSNELVTSDPVWLNMWSATWHNAADAVAAVSVQHLITPSIYDTLTQPMRAAIGPEFPSRGGPDNDQPTELS